MSATFILEYAGCPVKFDCLGNFKLAAQDNEATPFTDEAGAWGAAHRASLVPERCRVVNLYERSLRTDTTQPAGTPAELAGETPALR